MDYETSEQREIERLRYTILHLLPQEVQEALKFYPYCSTTETDWFKMYHLWLNDARKRLLDLAGLKLYPKPEWNPMASDRANCPICNGEPSGVLHGPGFALPLGLERHLFGHGNNPSCYPFTAVRDLARKCFEHCAKQNKST